MNTLVTTHQFRRVVVVHCQGELDLSVRSELASELSMLPALHELDELAELDEPPRAGPSSAPESRPRASPEDPPGRRADPAKEPHPAWAATAAPDAGPPHEAPTAVADAVVVDLTDVTFLDCAALSVLIDLADRCIRTDRHFLLSGPRTIVRRMLGALQLDRVFVITSTVAEAVTLAESWWEPSGAPSAGPLGPLPPQTLPPPSEGETPSPKDHDPRGPRWTI